MGQLEADAVSGVLASGQLWRGNGHTWGGPQTHLGSTAADRLEDAFAERLGLQYVHAVNSGTSANEAAIASLGLDPGDEVICPAASPIFIPLAILAAGCIPVFADVDPKTLLIDPDAIEATISENTRAVVAVHLWGMPAPMARIMAVAERFRLAVVEDCAQAWGTLIGGRPVGTFGYASSFSLQQTKHITSGEGGIFVTRNPEAYARAVLYSNCGIPSFRFGVEISGEALSPVVRGHIRFGHNHRIGELQAAVAMAQLSRINEFIGRRAELAELIKAKLLQTGDDSVGVPPAFPGCTTSYWRYPILVPSGYGTYKGISYFEPVFREMNDRRLTPFGLPIPQHVNYDMGSCPGAEQGASRIRSVSVHHGLTDQELQDSLNECLSDLRHV
ncbi:MAG TPA: DegT/DnrJ/EryC1/StrS family aminotransferase [Candidatus Limnocylindrales bacterium]|nr:DegT/DnrJ/EryC1/StrS family aminotransferase [Candidatus Limnocylindrales bacterium]